MIHQKALYLHVTPKGESEDLMLFVVPRVHQVATLNGCQNDAVHQGHDHTLSLLQETPLVAWDDQPDVTSHQKLHTLSTA